MSPTSLEREMNEILTVSDELLDEMFSHEAGCEASHIDADNRVCSGEVTHRLIRSCGMGENICSSAATRAVSAIASGRFKCNACNTPIARDWTLVPA